MRRWIMKIDAGNTFNCACGDCEAEVKVAKTCAPDKCGPGDTCDVNMSCCGKPMVLK